MYACVLAWERSLRESECDGKMKTSKQKGEENSQTLEFRVRRTEFRVMVKRPEFHHTTCTHRCKFGNRSRCE
ncbi:hypothetical protein AHF37_02142 [Paragonimus kellicotti]|nr:hypothetical protein AHF37_02142 [Paragonimus kellicotti]